MIAGGADEGRCDLVLGNIREWGVRISDSHSGWLEIRSGGGRRVAMVVVVVVVAD